MHERISDAEKAHRAVRMPGAIIAKAARCCICKFISSAEGVILAFGCVVIQSDPAVTRVTVRIPKANASTLLVLYGPVVQEEDQMNADLRDTLRATGNLELVQPELGHVQFATTSEYAHVTNSNPRA